MFVTRNVSFWTTVCIDSVLAPIWLPAQRRRKNKLFYSTHFIASTRQQKTVVLGQSGSPEPARLDTTIQLDTL